MKQRKNSFSKAPPWLPRNQGYHERSVETRDTIPRYLIVCEGERTEPDYFQAFRLSKVVKDAMQVVGAGCNTVSTVEEAIRIRDTEGPFDKVWCVFDRDDFPAQRMRRAIELAEREGISVAYSNEAFELWYLLHFQYLDTGISRDDYKVRLAKLLKKPYKKNDATMYNTLIAYQKSAIRNAERLLLQYHTRNPVRDKPSTTVHLLVKELNQYLG